MDLYIHYKKVLKATTLNSSSKSSCQKEYTTQLPNKDKSLDTFEIFASYKNSWTYQTTVEFYLSNLHSIAHEKIASIESLIPWRNTLKISLY